MWPYNNNSRYSFSTPGYDFPEYLLGCLFGVLPVFYMVLILVANFLFGSGWAWPFVWLWFVIKIGLWALFAYILVCIIVMPFALLYSFLKWVRKVIQKRQVK